MLKLKTVSNIKRFYLHLVISSIIYNYLKKDIDQIIIAGAFGSYLGILSSIEIGMFPDIPINRFHQIGNAAIISIYFSFH